MADRFKIDKTCSLSQDQYDIIVKYHKTGVKPSANDLKRCGLEGNPENLMTSNNGVTLKKGVFSRFKAIAKRLKIRQSDNSLIFYANSKIVIPYNQFVEVIKEAHESNGQKHLNMTKTMEQLSKKYSMGSRQFGIREETVREVVRACKHGSCSKYSWKKHKATDKSTTVNKNNGSTNDSLCIGSPEAHILASDTNRLLQNLPTLAPGPVPRFEKLIAVPCVFQMPVSSLQQRLPMVYAGPRATTPIVSCTITPLGAVSTVSSADQSCLDSNITNTLSNLNHIKILPQPPANLIPSLLQLLSKPTTEASDQAKMQNEQNIISIDNKTIEGLNQSESLTNISQTIRACGMQQVNTSLDINNKSLMKEYGIVQDNENCDENLEKNTLSKSCVIKPEPNEDQGQGEKSSLSTTESHVTPSLPPMIYPHLWHNLKAIQEEQEPYNQINAAIKDLQTDIRMAMAGNYRTADSLQRKMLVLELMIQNAKMTTKAFLPDGDDFMNI